MTQEEATIQSFLKYLSPSIAEDMLPPTWPPDAFAVAASLLQESGAYLSVLEEWPPKGKNNLLRNRPENWAASLRRIGLEWRSRWPEQSPPAQVVKWWQIVRQHEAVSLAQISENRTVACALLQICAAADEASYDVGIELPGHKKDRFQIHADAQLPPRRSTGSTLCRQISPTQLRVLPKFHTPQTGMTLRSLSHNLALWPGYDVIPLWFTARLAVDETLRAGDRHSLSLLLVPWPTVVTPRQFVADDPSCGQILNMPKDRFGFFSYRREPDPSGARDRLASIYAAAKRLTDRIDGIIMPELALNASEHEVVREWVTGQESFLIAGIGSSGIGGRPGQNRVGIEIPAARGEMGKGHRVRAHQDKHHRWRLDRGQIVQYGLGGQLDPARSWWEHTEAAARHLTFVSLRPWLSLCALVCEDLARQDPVARLVRAVGPNLVIALLMDGPQLPSRWPARYATVLADDPGSSVLTLTSIGMCEFSRPPGKPISRTIALWKDARSGEAIPIDLAPGADAILLNLVRSMDEEWTADGRSDRGSAGYPTLAGIHPVFAERTNKV